MENDILTLTALTALTALAALVAAYVGVVKGLGLSEKYTHFIVLSVAAIFILVPDAIQQAIIKASVISLTASGAYNYTKKRGDTP